jgi:uncharacterized Zn ribbon protein
MQNVWATKPMELGDSFYVIKDLLMHGADIKAGEVVTAASWSDSS